MKTQTHFIHSKKPALLTSMLVLTVLILAACQSTAKSTSTQVPAAPASTNTSAPAATAVPAVEEPTIMVATDPKLGKILVDGKGMTLYLFTKDTPGVSNCNAGCLAKWPPLLTGGSPKAGDGVNAALLGSAKLSDGSMIVTYNQMPLYYWVNDTKPGDTTGEDVGNVWFVVSPEGMAVQPPAQVTDTPAAAAVEEPTIMVATDPKLGKILVDGKGMTLYLFTKDTTGVSNCNAGCLAKWPPLLTAGSPKAGDGVDDSKLGSAKLADGRMIVTYYGMPLYYWVNDTKAGDTTGEDVGGVWYVVSPDGQKVEPAVETTETPTAAPAAAAGEPTIMVATDPILGKILVDGKGMTLYIFTKDEADKSNCNAGCLAKWPPLLTQGSPKLGDGVDDSKVGFATLADGSKIVTYNHMPLYYWVNDKKAGDTTGQGVGGVWFVVNPDGEKIEKSGEATINVATDPTLGKILVDGNGMTLYIYTKDGPNQSNCNAGCLAKWPPLLTKGNPVLGEGVDPKLIGTATLADGSLIVTYNGMPLYYWVNDTKAGDTTGQGVGSVWFVIGPDGKVIGN